MTGRNMRLNAVRIAGYRSLYNVEVSPKNLTVLTGPNNSGKTNFVEALDFLAETSRHGLEVAINRKGGIENIIHRRMARTRRSLSFTIRIALDTDELAAIFRNLTDIPANIYITHSFTIVPL